jgi:hypothetical protein
MKSSLLKLSVLLFLGVSSVSTAARAEIVYLGGAFDYYHCSRIAGDAGFSHFRYGGFVGGYYVVNACFGERVTPLPQPKPSCSAYNIETYSWSVGVGASQVKILANLSQQKELYVEADKALDRLSDLAHELASMGKAQSSCSLLRQFFLDNVRTAYNEAKQTFLQAHHVALDPKVGRAWLSVEESYSKLLSNL